MLQRRPTAVLQPGFPFPLTALHPPVAGFARDLITTAQLRHRPPAAVVVVDKTFALVHHTAHLPGHASLLHAPAVRTKLSTISPVCSVNHVPGLYRDERGAEAPHYPYQPDTSIAKPL